MAEASDSKRAALVTGGSSGIGLAIARALAEDGYGITLSARRPEKLTAAGDAMRADGFDVLDVPAQMTEEGELRSLVEAHADRFGRLDVLVNNAGVGIGEALDQLSTKKVDMQLDVNLRAIILMTRECLPLLKEAGAEHSKALIVNTASIAGKSPQPWLSVYSATKAAVLAWSQSNQKEVAGTGIQVTALAPGFVDTPMTEFVKDSVGAENMIRPEDLAESVRFLLGTSPNCLVPEIVFMRPDEAGGGGSP
jgi:NAD(P)-dependent dehydrogenase (short-subunit alcohol dehydrogenase family)